MSIVSFVGGLDSGKMYFKKKMVRYLAMPFFYIF